MPRNPTKDWAYSRDVGRAIVALRNARSIPSPVYNVGAEEVWPVSAWAERLGEAFPGFELDIGCKPEDASIEVYGTRDRAPLNVGRLKSEIGFAFRYDRARAFEDYLEWASDFRCWRIGGPS
jgi:nucleoside-diphosphate-sugar epimerase